ncbi:hypothetical protein CORC01_00964 [Colletotrichum orchidophilum]|uniref:Uncharacterized protein n=1 Tax=Colletotrichum orchidophilum TaxID=1209926 RepID=A0A1G4BQP3_9PEZI|nr:uncharacterized protein CORC01_00964 [Colletotrichum orchidophilum]OHF03645.1 hypothetical protein CORC01_00964 [Colletotrichum orchidophilum]
MARASASWEKSAPPRSFSMPSPARAQRRPTVPQRQGTRGSTKKPASTSFSGKDIHETEASEVWKQCAFEAQMENTLVIAVVHPKQEGHLKIMRLMESKARTSRRIFICNAGALQKVIEQEINKKRGLECKHLRIVVSSVIQSICYQISSVVKSVFIKISGIFQRNTPYKLRIDEKSTYCSENSDSWGYRNRIAHATHELVHFFGCYFPYREKPANYDAQAWVRDQKCITPPTLEVKEEIVNTLREVTHIQNPQSSSAPESPPTPNTGPPAGEGGLKKLKALFAAVVGLVAGYGAAGGVVWFNSSGVFITGPLGLKLAVGYVSIGAAGAACAAGVGVGTAAAAAAATYLVPWERLWGWITSMLSSIWGTVKDTFVWLWEKIKSAASYVGSWF